jgi:uncharacterized protein YlaI
MLDQKRNTSPKVYQERNNKIKLSKLGQKNPMWVDRPKHLPTLHTWVRRNKPKKELCEHCNEKPAFDLANVSGKYLRNINDYIWLCRSCHMIFDNRMDLRDDKGRFISAGGC